MKPIPYQHCELGPRSALPGWPADSCETSEKPSESAKQMTGVTTVSPPALSPALNTRNIPRLQAKRRVLSRSVTVSSALVCVQV